MKKTKRNIAIIVVLLFVCAAIYFNWSYNTQWGKADAEMAAAEDAATAAVKAEEEAAAASASASDDYFAKARLTRQQSRDEALSLLKSASTAEGASQATIDSAMSAISAMASRRSKISCWPRIFPSVWSISRMRASRSPCPRRPMG